MGQGTPGYNAAFYGTGTSTAMTDEACSEISGTVFQVTDTAKRILDHDVAVVVKANAVTQSGNYTINYNTGTVTFTDGTHTGETITITANYLPRHLVAKLRTGTVSLSWDSEDTTALADAGEAHTLTILRVAIDLEAIQLLADVDLYGTTSLWDIFASRAIKVLEFQPAGASYDIVRARGMFQGATLSTSGPAGVSAGRLSFIGGNERTTLVSYN